MWMNKYCEHGGTGTERKVTGDVDKEPSMAVAANQDDGTSLREKEEAHLHTKPFSEKTTT